MSSDVQIKFNREGKLSVLKGPGVRLRIKAHCENIKHRAEAMSESGVADYTVVVDTHSVSAHGHVWAKDAPTIASNLKHDALVKALSEEPGVSMHE